ncbi:MAG: hypothetical protein II753_03075 [Spirochaetales bacterium]|nr:hypothetical protein [Spirochaetales bacterium]
MPEKKDNGVMESFGSMSNNWASEVINTLLSVKQNALDIPKGFILGGIAIKEGFKKGDVDILFSFRKEDK